MTSRTGTGSSARRSSRPAAAAVLQATTTRLDVVVLDQAPRQLAGEAAHLGLRLGPVRVAAGVADVDEVLGRQQVDHGPGDGQAAEAGVEHPDRPIHGRRLPTGHRRAPGMTRVSCWTARPAATRRCSMAARTSEGFLHGDIPYLRLGQGPPLVMVQGLSPQHDIPQGWQRRMTLSCRRPAGRRLHRLRGEPQARPRNPASRCPTSPATSPARSSTTSVSRRPAGHAARADPVALQLAVDRPDLVRRLVVGRLAAYKLGPEGCASQAELARLTRPGTRPPGGRR